MHDVLRRVQSLLVAGVNEPQSAALCNKVNCNELEGAAMQALRRGGAKAWQANAMFISAALFQSACVLS
jgi:hypothetical protein